MQELKSTSEGATENSSSRPAFEYLGIVPPAMRAATKPGSHRRMTAF